MNKATIFDIQRGSFVDGPGIRTTVFFKGCNLRCKWCHNPESQEKRVQLLNYADRCEECGKEYVVEEILSEILKDKDYYGTRGGATFSGGECMIQIDFLEEILKACKENGVGTAVDTAGCVSYEYFKRILPYTDIFLYDIKCYSEELHKEGTGACNKLILDNLKRLKKDFQGEIIIRIPVISGFNASTEELSKIAKVLKEIGEFKVELLPYHAMGEHKWLALNKQPITYAVPTKEEMEEYKKFFI